MTRKRRVFAAAFLFVVIALAIDVHSEEPTWLDPESPSVGVSVISIGDLAEYLSKENLRSPAKAGVLVLGTVVGSPAEKAGVKPLDVITKIERKQVRDAAEFFSLIGAAKTGSPLKFSGHAATVNAKGASAYSAHNFKVSPVRSGTLCLQAMEKDVDEVEGSSTLTHPQTPKLNEKSDISLSIDDPNGLKPTLRLHVQYVAKDLLGIGKFSIRSDAKKVDVDLSRSAVHSDFEGGSVLEWFSVPLTDELREGLIDAIKSARTIVRLSGLDFYKDRDLSFDEKNRLYAALVAYEEILFRRGERRFAKKGD